MTSLLLYPLLTTAAYYLGARALVTRFLWSRYPVWLDSFMLCSACSGFWYGLGAGIYGRFYGVDFLGLPARDLSTPLVIAFCSTVWTPLVSALHATALDRLGEPGSSVHTDKEEAHANKEEPPRTVLEGDG